MEKLEQKMKLGISQDTLNPTDKSGEGIAKDATGEAVELIAKPKRV